MKDKISKIIKGRGELYFNGRQEVELYNYAKGVNLLNNGDEVSIDLSLFWCLSRGFVLLTGFLTRGFISIG